MSRSAQKSSRAPRATAMIARHTSGGPAVRPSLRSAARVLVLATLQAAAALLVAGPAPGDDHRPPPATGALAHGQSANGTGAHFQPVNPLRDVVSERGQRARGLYFPGPQVRLKGAAGIARIVHAARMDAAVIDLKDGQGRVTYNSRIPVLQEQRRPFIPDVHALVRDLHAADVYLIARIVCFSDPIMPTRHLDRAVLDSRPVRRGRPWVSWGTGGTWLDPTNPANQELVRQMAVEAAEAGFDEIQLDYIRFPVDEGTRYAVFSGGDPTRRRRDVLIDLLASVDEAITIPIGVDVFGLTALRRGDPAGLGQSLGEWTAHVEVFTPMLYINNFRRWRRGTENRAGSFVYAGTSTLRQRLGAGPVIRPLLQGFRTGADHYDAAFIAEQVRAARGAGADGFLFWQPGGIYTLVTEAMRGVARWMVPFPIDERIALRAARSNTL